MPDLAAMLQLVLGDFRERTRRYSFLVTLLGTLFFGFLVITGKWALRLGAYRGEYNSAWVGSLMGSASTMMLAFFGFYLVKNSLSRDRQSGVGEIIAATPLSNSSYVLAKFVSNFAVLAAMTAVLAAAAVVMQLLSHVEGSFDLWALLAPFLFVCLPAMTLVAATAVLFESVKWLRGTLGNILYLPLAEFAFLNTLFTHNPLLDFAGLGMFIPSMEEAALAAYPGAKLGLEIGFVGFVPGAGSETMNLFRWDGIAWSLGMVPLRLVWIAGALGLAGLATFNFDRFDPSRTGRAKPGKQKKRLAVVEEPIEQHPPSAGWSAVSAATFNFNILRMLNAEFRLMLKGYHWSWYVIAAGLIAVQSAVPYEYARSIALPAAMIWPLAIWSGMGTREARYGTDQLLVSSPYPVARQFPAIWIAGVTVAVVMSGGLMVRASVGGEVAHLQAILVGALFAPTLALALGTLSGTKKLFEVCYLIIWYVGPVNHLVPLDFLGATNEAAAGNNPAFYLAITIVLAVLSILARRSRTAAVRG